MGMQNSVTIPNAMRSTKLLCGGIQSAMFHSGWVSAHTRFMRGLRRMRSLKKLQPAMIMPLITGG